MGYIADRTLKEEYTWTKTNVVCQLMKKVSTALSFGLSVTLADVNV